ncbi:MAG: T9SS type A sorting domain-containing protein [Bacteroidetes bacterium]|nr:T9SS type A sorting domain-containing protein [Bacteroidota bacterium]
MKNRFFVLGLAALMAQATLSAQSLESLPTALAKHQRSTELANPDQRSASLLVGKNVEQSQAITYVNMYSNDYLPTWEQYNTNRTFVYDKGTNTLMLIHNARVFASNQLAGGKVEAFISTDGGSTFTTKNIFEKTGDYRAFPTLALVNKGVTSADDLGWCLWGYSYLKSSNWSLSGNPALFKLSDPTPLEVPMTAPDLNNGGGYIFGFDALVPVTGTRAGVFHASRLSLSNGGTGQFGAYGQFYFNFVAEDVSSSLPDEWALSNWRAGEPNLTYNSEMLSDADAAGNVYVAVDNVWIEDETARVPGVAVSKDGAQTWGPWNKMPKALLDEYATANFSSPKNSIYDPFGTEGFVVTGTDRYSYIMRLGHVDDQNRFDRLDLIEAEYKNGAWSVRKVAELNDFNPLTFQVIDTASTSQGKWVPYVSSVLGHELQISKTADNAHLIIKWVDANTTMRYGVEPPMTILYGANPPYTYGTLDSLFTTDLYFSVRAIDADNWGGAVNITNDAKVDKGTKIPAIVPSITKVPVMYHQGVTNDRLGATHPLKSAGWPDAFVERELGGIGASVNRFMPQTVRFGTFNALNPSSVEETTENLGFSLNNAKPNPATEVAEITFSLDVAGNVSLVLFDMLGNRVNTLYNGQMDAGLHGLSVDPSTLSNGTYYFTLTVNGKSITKTMVVMK